MLKKKALQKILLTTFTVFLLMVVYFLPTKDDLEPEKLDVDYTVEYVDKLDTHAVYLLGNNHLLVKTSLMLEGNHTLEKIASLIRALTINSGFPLPDGLTGILSEKTKLLHSSLEQGVLTLDFNDAFLEIDRSLEERMVEAIVYSVTSFPDITSVMIQVNGSPLTKLPQTGKILPEKLTRDFGINKVYEYTALDGIKKVSISYLTLVDDTYYVVPVTKYVNDTREKIQIIVENLSSNYIYQPNLTSFLDQDAELLNYQLIDSDATMILDFNDCLFDSNNQVLEEVIYTVASSVFDNYDVEEVSFRVNDVEVAKKYKKDIES